jgi:hypothetical protein
MNNLPIDIIRNIYEYDNTYRDQFDEALIQLRCHCLIYRCSECFKPYNRCYCYCPNCRTYLRFCKQIYFEPNDLEEDELEDVIALN